MLTARERLDVCQKRLLERGVVDVKWTFNPELVPLKLEVVDGKVYMGYVPVSEEVHQKIYEDAAHLLEAYLDGKMVPMKRLGDSHCNCCKCPNPHFEMDHADFVG